MIQLVFDSIAKIVPEWENEQERLIFCLSPIRLGRSELLHKRLEAGGAQEPAGGGVGMVALRYVGDVVREARVILELPDETWDALASQVDGLLEES